MGRLDDFKLGRFGRHVVTTVMSIEWKALRMGDVIQLAVLFTARIESNRIISLSCTPSYLLAKGQDTDETLSFAFLGPIISSRYNCDTE